MVGDAFARVFGGKVVPQEVAQALQREAEVRARPLAGGRVLAPNRYTVTLGAADHDRLTGDEQRVIRLLRDCITEHLAEYGWDTYGDVVVHLERSETLHTGQFRTSSSVDPNASRRSTAHPRTAGDPAMSQQPPQHPEGDQRGQHGGYGNDQGQEQDPAHAQQYGYGQGPGYNQNYDPGYTGQQGGYDQNQGQGQQYGYDQGYDSSYGPDHGQGQNQGRGQGYAQQGGYGYGQGQGGYGYDQNYGQGGYDQNYGDQNYGAPGGYGYDQNQGYGGGYSPDPGAAGYAPPAVQTGARQLTAVLSLDDGSHRSYQLTLGSNVVGRGQDAQFRLPDTGVSRRHLEITWDGQVAVLADLGSTNGTTVNGSPVQTWQLVNGDVVRVGHTSLAFHVQG
ncbi:MAG: DUF3662 and FHA domain-containing protein [Actinomycetota bacterium]|nr:DUF3662 and FHA domain-containing protein [Actinomycetota bacterium]